MTDLVKNARVALRAAEKRLEQALRTQYPVGHPIVWQRGGHNQLGHLTRHGYGDRFQVLNARTKKLVWLSSGDII